MAEADEPRQYVVAHVREALARELSELNVEIAVAGRGLFLSGEVATAERCRAVARVAAEHAPGYRIHNEVSVTPVAGTGEHESLS